MPAIGRRILIIGAYGLIGAAAAQRLTAEGFEVVGLGRALAKGRASNPRLRWIAADLADLTAAEAWRPHLDGVDAVVNAAGLLQNGLGDRVDRVQSDAIMALIDACAALGVRRFVQISAPGVGPEAAHAFYRSKAAADAQLAESELAWTILRPGLVLGAPAYGGSRLLRMLAAFPLIQPIAMEQAQIQTVALAEVARAVAHAIEAEVTGDFDLVEPEGRSLLDVTLMLRQWIGAPKPAATLRAPMGLTRLIGWAGDVAGWLGWRPPLRSTAIEVLRTGVFGDPEPWRRATGMRFSSLEAQLTGRPATHQDRVAARAGLIFPGLLAIHAGFWIASGAVGLVQFDAAREVLRGGLPAPLDAVFVGAGALADIALGLGALVRPFATPALWSAVALSIAYLIGAAALTPSLWADPLGPMVKVFPAIALALALLALNVER